MLNAFWRVAPSDRFRLFAILLADIFFFAMDFNVRTSSAIQATRLPSSHVISDFKRRRLITGQVCKRKPRTQSAAGGYV